MTLPDKTPKWYAVYVNSRAEKKVYEELTRKEIEAYLPLQRKLRQWSDRKKWVDMPLISGYLFVHITRMHYEVVLQCNHVLAYVRFEGKAAVIRDRDIDILKRMLGQKDIEVEVTLEDLKPGAMVEIISGPMTGIIGELIHFRGKNKVALRIPPLGHILLIESPEKNLAPYKEE